MEAVAQEIAERLRPAPFVRIVTHIDTDGITGGAIASEALDRAGISHEVAFVKKLDEAVLTELKRKGTPLVWFIDLGAGMLHALHGLDAVITDHHVPTEREVPKAFRSDLVRFTESQDRVLMLNPHLEGEGWNAGAESRRSSASRGKRTPCRANPPGVRRAMRRSSAP